MMNSIIWDCTPTQLKKRLSHVRSSGLIRASMQHQIENPEKYWRMVAACYPSGSLSGITK